jgi:signal transduction histidine kinase
VSISRTAKTEIVEAAEHTARLTALGKLAARVAHELNNPLDGVLRYINLAMRTIDDDHEPKLRKYLTESRGGLLRMAEIITDLLEYSRGTIPGFELSDVNEVIDQAIRAHAESAAATGIVITADYRCLDMPQVRGSRLYQVCGNLIRNAMEAMPRGGRLTVVSSIMREDVVIEVADTGVGLPEKPERIFEPFFTTKKRSGGVGLGLALCKELVEGWGGTLLAAPAEKAGAVFTVRIPRSRLNHP